MPHGRAVALLGLDEDPEDLANARTEDTCPCPQWLVKPNGDIHQCGCEDSPIIGSTYSGLVYELPQNYCCRSSEFRDECIELEADSYLV